MQHLEASGAVRHIYVVRQLRVNNLIIWKTNVSKHTCYGVPSAPAGLLFASLWMSSPF